MSEISTTEAKKRLSELLRRAQGGETITVTRYGQPVAIISLPEPAKQPAPDLSEFRARHGRVRSDSLEIILQMRDEERYWDLPRCPLRAALLPDQAERPCPKVYPAGTTSLTAHQ